MKTSLIEGVGDMLFKDRCEWHETNDNNVFNVDFKFYNSIRYG
jgi:hypothetical protein